MANKKWFSPSNNISVNGTVHLPGDKSIGIRSIIILSQSYGISNVHNVSSGEDVQTAISAIKKLKVQIHKISSNHYQIFGLGIGFKKFKGTINFNNSGTTLRLLTGLLATSEVDIKLIGDRSLSKRPIRIIPEMEKFFATFFPKNKNYLPIQIAGYPDSIQSELIVDKPSAQMVSACILAGMNSHGITTIEAPNLQRDHTELMLKYLKYPIKIKNKKNSKIIRIRGKQFLKAERKYVVPGDPSSSAFLIVLALLSKNSSLSLPNVLLNPKRIGFLNILKKMGGSIKILNKKKQHGETAGTIQVKSSLLKGIRINKEIIPNIIDEVPILMIAASFANGETFFPNLEELRIKESDRLLAMENNLKKIGIKTKRKNNDMTILGLGEKFYSNKLITIDSYKDHRIALSFAIMAMVSKKKILIKDFDSANVSYPNFLNDIQKIKNKKFKQIIVGMDGPVGSGKTSVAKYAVSKIKNSLFLDSGLLYRFLAKKHLDQKSKTINVKKLIVIAQTITLKQLQSSGLHSQKINKLVSTIAKIPKIRSALLPVQRNIIFNNPYQYVFVSGRDINSKVVQSADLKIYIDAPLKMRAQRRFLELKSKNKDITFKEVLKTVANRDYLDKNRSNSPLVKTKDSVLINNTGSNIRSTFVKIQRLIRKVQSKKY
ncbi:3-phosphoshikimate 1-carboxyvinyltransferase [Pelagibacteraceae bacterium]|nr:3-phosphoshikimate 1-carboxyvinyltransferase [Pelagibacteraceae bacterium]